MFSFGDLPSCHVVEELESELQKMKKENRELKEYIAKQKLEGK